MPSARMHPREEVVAEEVEAEASKAEDPLVERITVTGASLIETPT